MKLKKLSGLLLSTSMIASGLGPVFTTMVSAETATASSSGTSSKATPTIITSAGEDLTLSKNEVITDANTVLADVKTINLGTYTLTIQDGWTLKPDQNVTISGNGGTVELTGEPDDGLPNNPTSGMIVVGGERTNSATSILTINQGVTIQSSVYTPILVTATGSLVSSGIIKNTTTTGNKTAITLGSEAGTPNDSKVGPSLTLNSGSETISTGGRAIHVLGYTRSATIKATGATITGGSAAPGIGLYFAGSGTGTFEKCTITASLAVLNIGGNLTFTDPTITSQGNVTGEAYGSGYEGPNAAIVEVIQGGGYYCKDAAIILKGTGSISDANKTQGVSPIMVYTVQDGEYEVSNTNGGTVPGVNGQTGYTVSNVVQVQSPDLTFSGSIPPNYLANNLSIQLSNKSYNSTLYSYTSSSLSDLVNAYYTNKNSSTSIYTSTGSYSSKTWNTTGVTLTFNSQGSAYVSIPLYVGNNETITIPTGSLPHRDDYTFGGWATTQGGTTKVTTITTQGAATSLPAQILYAIWTYNPPYSPAPPATPPEVNQPDDDPITDDNTNADDFTPNSGINSGVQGTGPGFTENGSVTTMGTTSGNHYTYTQNVNGTKAAVTQNAQGQITHAVLTVPTSAIQNGSASVSLGSNTTTRTDLTIPGNDTSSTTAPLITVNLPSTVTNVKVDVDLTQGTGLPGTVAMVENSDGQLVPIMKTTLSGNVLSIPLTGSQRVYIMNNAKTFSDESSALAYAQNASSFMSARDLMTGMGTSTPKPFGYLEKLTRGQFATIVWRLEGSPATTGSYPSGIVPGAWNADAARWAVQNGLMGQGSQFNAEQNITREQLTAILYRFVGSPSVDLSVLNSYSDANQIYPTDFRAAMAWGVNEGLIGQGTNGLLDPGSQAARMNVAAIFQRFIEKQY